MEGESEHKLAVNPPEQPPQVKLESSPVWWNEFISGATKEPTKLAFLAVFILYFLGFAIWHFYLAQYGVTSLPFIQTEYISAAFCFLILFASLSIPPFIFFRLLLKNVTHHGLYKINSWDKNLVVILIVWQTLDQWLIQIFFPQSALSPLGNKAFNVIFACFWMHFVLGIILFVKGGYYKVFASGNAAKLTPSNEKARGSTLLKYFNPFKFWPLYVAGFIFVRLWFNTELSKFFLFTTFIYWFIWSNPSGVDIKEAWPKSNKLLRMVMALVIFLYFLIYIQGFSRSMFSKVPKSVGGGRPEEAFFVMNKTNSEVAEALGVQRNYFNGSSRAEYGPVKIILRTDDEILFMNDDDNVVGKENETIIKQIRSQLVDGVTFASIKK